MKKALFLDRDGIINEDVGYTHRIEDFKFRDGIFDICRTAQDLGYIIVIVTNQAGIGRGFYTEEDFQKLTDWMLDAFKKQNITISAVEYCPFHAEYGIGKYKIDSFRRKPNPGMILDACDALDIDPKISIMIGDKVDDITAAERAGILTLILVTKTIYTVGVPSHTVIIEYDCLKNIQILISRLNSKV